MSEIKKGDSVEITGGPDSGKFGEVFWWGESKFGDGMRAGVKGTDGQTYWVDEEHLEKADSLPAPEPVQVTTEERNAYSKGDRVQVARGKEAGAVGELFWWGESKFGDGMRAGIKTDDGETVWAAGAELEKLEGADPQPANRTSKPQSLSTSASDEPPESYAPSSEMPIDEEIPLPDEPPPELDEGLSLADVMEYETAD